MILGIKHVVLLSSDDHGAVVVVLGEPDVDAVVVHDALDVLPAEADETAVYARVYVNLLAVLTVL